MSFVRELVLKMDSYYSVLGVGTESSADQIRCAYRKLAMVRSDTLGCDIKYYCGAKTTVHFCTQHVIR